MNFFYYINKLVLRLPASLLMCALVAACANTAVKQSDANTSSKGSLIFNAQGKPDNRSSTPSNNWQELIRSIEGSNIHNTKIEINQVYDGSLRLLIPDKVLFKRGSLKINKNIFPVLNNLVIQINNNQDLRLKIVGHAAQRQETGSIKEQLQSLNRAVSASIYLINHGMPSTLIELEGRGSVDPLVQNDSVNNRQINRRVEFYIYQLK